MFGKKLKRKLEDLTIGDAVTITDEDGIRWTFARNARFGQEGKPWYEVSITMDYDQEFNSGKVFNLDRKVETIEDLFEVFNAPFMERWKNIGGAVENPCFG